jgi:large subunit ribosomal protein L25
MAPTDQTTLSVDEREVTNSRAVRRLRRAGQVPGVVYGGGEDPVAFAVDARMLRHVLADAGAVIDLRVGDATGLPVVIKELARHPVTGETTHLDLLRVRLDRPIQATVVLELIGADDAPGVKEGGVLEHITRELTIEALPTDIPDAIQHDVSEMAMNDTITLDAVTAPDKVTLVGDPETLIATLTPPRLQVEEDTEIEAETEVVGEGEGDADADGGGESAAAESDSE